MENIADGLEELADERCVGRGGKVGYVDVRAGSVDRGLLSRSQRRSNGHWKVGHRTSRGAHFFFCSCFLVGGGRFPEEVKNRFCVCCCCFYCLSFIKKRLGEGKGCSCSLALVTRAAFFFPLRCGEGKVDQKLQKSIDQKKL